MEFKNQYWTFVRNDKKLIYKIERDALINAKVGKWMIFVTEKYYDKVWNKIKELTENGELVDACKITRKGITYTSVICVYLYDSDDVDDVFRVAKKLIRELELNNTIAYKEDSETYAGNYSYNSEKPVTKYNAKKNDKGEIILIDKKSGEVIRKE